MKFPVKFMLLLNIPVLAWAGLTDPTVLGVKIESDYQQSIFPKSWQGGAINATGEQIDPDEKERILPVIIRSLNKYPQKLLSLTLKSVYLLKEMKFYEAGFGGTNSSDAVYITSKGETLGYTDAYIEQTFHHEFSSILYRGYIRFLDTVAWKNANIPGFDYNDPENGVGAIKNNTSSQGLDTLLAREGMLTQYAMSGLENDINTIAQNLFLPDPGFWEMADRFPGIGEKVKLLIAFYGRLNPVFTEEYFRSFARQ